MALNPEVWGPHYWFVLHTAALTYPLNPNEITKKKYYNLIYDMPLFIPHTESAKNFSELIEKYPLKPYLDSRASLNKWIHFIHNKINHITNKPEINILNASNVYNDLYKPISHQLLQEQKWREYISYISIISVLIISGVFLYKQ